MLFIADEPTFQTCYRVVVLTDPRINTFNSCRQKSIDEVCIFLYEICGPLRYEVHIDELSGNSLAPYEVKTIEVEMHQEDREKYEIARECYTNYLRKARINFDQPNGWSVFLRKTSESLEGRQAFQSYLFQKKLSQA